MSNEFLRPLSELPVPANLLGVLTDIDDTLTTEGEVPAHVVAAIARQSPKPLRFIGVGEQIDDLQTFRAKEFVDALFTPIGGSDTPQA